MLLRYLPLRKRAQAVKLTKAAKMLAVSKGRAQREQLPVLEEQLLRLGQSIGEYEARIPRQRELGAFLHKIADLMDEHNLKEQVIKPGGQLKSEELNCIPVDMQCKGRLGEMFEFYKRLRALDRLVRIEQVKLTNDCNFSGEVTMETRAVIYYAAGVEKG